ncbi:GrpB family protein [Ornithinibacillus sp. L9]|uniref:GrpB family protein n=1 Tax=Ornithinibacillus caprae TaxID=2678566 RepID=A0A6N8FLX8_9BACI|nr:GrpB family protein [Ornithinibacillus caprae]MUK88318.1 GrpB family protein [Ornithinibacillus caprae]
MKDVHDESNWPIWAKEKIDIVEPNPNWRKIGEQEKDLILNYLSSYGVSEVQHYGSTSIPNLPSKPIIDLMAKINSFTSIKDISSVLAKHDWHYVPPELDGRHWQRFFVKVINHKRVAHLHIMLETEERWNQQLLFRDLLRSNPHFIEEYANLKRNLAKKYAQDREGYTKAKTEFINYVLSTQS